ncbi:MAG: hypothetical protein ABI697_09805 [Devosia sp.]
MGRYLFLAEDAPTPRFFFHIRDGEGTIEDEEGGDFADLDAARAEARQSARDILADQIREGGELDGQIVVIADEAGLVLDEVPFRSVIKFPD